MPKIQFTFQCIAPTKSNGWEGSLLISQTYSEQQILKIAGQLDKSFSKYLFSKKTLLAAGLEKTSFELTVREILKKKLR